MTSLYRNSKMVSAPGNTVEFHELRPRIFQSITVYSKKFHSHHYHHCYGTFQSHTDQCHCRLFPGHDGDLSPLVKKTGWSPSPGHGYGDICFLRRWRWIFFLRGDVDGTVTKNEYFSVTTTAYGDVSLSFPGYFCHRYVQKDVWSPSVVKKLVHIHNYWVIFSFTFFNHVLRQRKNSP